MNRNSEIVLSKVPEVALTFWIIKIGATTLGETGGDALSMTMNLGYAISTAVFFAFFIVTVAAQVASKSFRPFLYWAVIVATTTAGTTMADFADRSLGIGYIGGSIILFTILMIVLGLAALLGLCVVQPHRLAQDRNILLADNSLLEHTRNRSRRLFRR